MIDLSKVRRWRKSSRSSGQGQCLEWADLGEGGVAVRDSKNPTGPALLFTPGEWTAFVDGVKAGEADL